MARQILYVVIYFLCNVFLTIHTLVYVITFVLCHHLYLDVCVSTNTELINISGILLYKNFFQKATNYECFSLLRFYSTKNISKTGIAFCWYCFRWDTARARHMYANNIGYVIMLITVNNWVFKFLWLGQFVMDYQRYFKGIWYLYCTSHSCTSTITLISILFLLHKFSFQDFLSFSIEISFGLQSS